MGLSGIGPDLVSKFEVIQLGKQDDYVMDAR